MVSDKEKTFNDDIIAHIDILSSPPKSRSISPDKHHLFNSHSSRHASPSKKNSLETVELPSLSSHPKSLESALKSESQGLDTSINETVPVTKKYKKTSKIKKSKTLKKDRSNVETKINDHLKKKRRPGRNRKETKSSEKK